MLSSARRWIGTFRRAALRQEGMRAVQDELAEALDHADSILPEAPTDTAVQDLKRKGYNDAQVDEFFAPPPPAPELKKP